MTHINRYLVVLALLIGIIVCALSVRNIDNSLQSANSRILWLESSVSAMEVTLSASQVAMMKTIDALSEQVDEQEILIVELERIINNQ